MKAPSEGHESKSTGDAAPLRRVQQLNQEQLIARLLHDLRNPVHSMRITVELFGRLTQQNADAAGLLARAARYVAPAETALASLTRQTERLSTYLAPPAPPALQPIAVNDWLTEAAMLLRESGRAVQVEVQSTLDDGVNLLADRPRLSHVLLHWALTRGGSGVRLSASDEAGQIRLRIEAQTEQQRSPQFALTPDELRTLIQNAGGELLEERPDAIAVAFAREL